MAQLIRNDGANVRPNVSALLNSPWTLVAAAAVIATVAVFAFLTFGGSPGGPAQQRALTSDEEGFGPIPVTNSHPGVAVPASLSAAGASATVGPPAGVGSQYAAAGVTLPPPPPPPTVHEEAYLPTQEFAPAAPSVQYSDPGLPPAPVLSGNFNSGGGSVSFSSPAAAPLPGGSGSPSGSAAGSD